MCMCECVICACVQVVMRVCVYACTHARTHAYMYVRGELLASRRVCYGVFSIIAVVDALVNTF